MAVQQNKKSHSRSAMRRGGQAKLAAPALSLNAQTGQYHRRHHLEADGSYKGVQYILQKEPAGE